MQRYETIKHNAHDPKNPLGFTRDRIWERLKAVEEWRIEVCHEGEWNFPDWLPKFPDKESALECCIQSFALGRARVIGLMIHNNDLTERWEVSQSEFITALMKFGKL